MFLKPLINKKFQEGYYLLRKEISPKVILNSAALKSPLPGMTNLQRICISGKQSGEISPLFLKSFLAEDRRSKRSHLKVPSTPSATNG